MNADQIMDNSEDVVTGRIPLNHMTFDHLIDIAADLHDGLLAKLDELEDDGS